MTQHVKFFCLGGKDFFDQHEAAHYLCMSASKFKMLLINDEIKRMSISGKIVFRKTELTDLVERQNK